MTGEDNNPVIQTTHGKVRGQLRSTVYGDQYFCFDGIPYGKPPLGELRFKSPQDVDPWDGVLSCTEVAQKSLQYNRYTKQNEGSEDCLYLNVYAKQLITEKPLPVMVYLHGGGFNTGDATRLSWGPDYFMMKDVLFITIGYRLGALGFVSFDDPELKVPGNAGLKDIILALKWINQNCQNFNGDCSNITLFGHSAGSCATNFLMYAEPAKGLFHKAILMAGLGLDLRKIPNVEYRLAQHIGFKGRNNACEIHAFLSTVDADQLVGFNFWTEEEMKTGENYAFGPTIESYETGDNILTSQPSEVLPTAWANGIPIMLGATSCEGLIMYRRYTEDPKLYEFLKEHPEVWLPDNLRLGCDMELQKTLAEKVIHLHFGDKELSVKSADCALDVKSYTFMYHPLHRLVKARLTYNTAPTYLYRFDFDSPTFNLYRIKHCGPNVRGVGHVDELSYIFFMQGSFELARDSLEFLTIRRMVDMWTAFAERSEPNTSLLAPVIWKPVESTGGTKCLNISHDLTFIDSPEAPKCAVWDSFYADANVPLY